MNSQLSTETLDQKTQNKTAQVKEIDVVIAGAGFGGLCMAIQLREEDNDNFVLLEKKHDIGGTWRDNSYPGCACDVQSHMYSYSFAPKDDWSKRYAPWNEIQKYILDTADKYNIRPFCRFNQEVTSAVFDEESGRWTVKTTSGDVYLCRHFILASGPLHVPQIPKIKGLENFKGRVFHSAQWDHDYDLECKNVVSIGTGGSAIQYCPEIAPKVKKLHVFQRTPAWVLPRDDRKYLGVEKTAFKLIPGWRRLHRFRLYWTNESRVWPMFNPSVAKSLSQIAKAWIRFQVKDKALARKLTPDYTIGCKRILISNKYYPMFNRDNVELVTEGIKEVKENSIVTQDGQERPIDCIILGTGFVVDPRIYMKDFELKGLGGRELNNDWKDHTEAYYGTSITGYPNLWMLVGPNTGLGHNSIIFMIEAQVKYILNCMKAIEQRESDYMDVKPEAQEIYNVELQKLMKDTVWSSGCQSWYQQADGRNTTLWPKSTWKFWLETLNVKKNDYNFIRLANDQIGVDYSADAQAENTETADAATKKPARKKRTSKKSATEPSAV
ncbi:flavin-containing monooxygenase [Litoribrevibacter albus]|uniref:4-hydroxyacetophenone monooxygenase n=1 Tax=Litoribrevibacter albus TaxID=1473156 RepID=A0AA37W5X6_9GAMM|nr:NAD(P)/FAD-dependent oxidoreductase [Litoribrevibacter albus]GLQ31542.1 4-hydroxyacetophenone monooxygenase [Litoribrevibacter albus]